MEVLLGWNSWDCYGASVTEDIVRQNADFMAKHLKQYGWEYIVVDIQWYEPNAKTHDYNPWTAVCSDGGGYAAVFNAGDNNGSIVIPLSDVEIYSADSVTELWSGDKQTTKGVIEVNLAPHGAKAFKII